MKLHNLVPFCALFYVEANNSENMFMNQCHQETTINHIDSKQYLEN